MTHFDRISLLATDRPGENLEMPASEIDDIFAGKSTGKSVQKESLTTPKEASTSKGKKKKVKEVEGTHEPVITKKKKKKSKDLPVEEAAPVTKKRKRTPPQEIVDSSLPIKRRKSEKIDLPKKSDIQKFKDSRGSSSSEPPFQIHDSDLTIYREAYG